MSRFRALAGLLILLWVVEFVNVALGYSLNGFGLVPRRLDGVAGILLSPLLHGSFAHLISNSGGLLALGGLVAIRGERHFVTTTLAIAILGGGLVWLFGRPALHIGASGLVFGYFGLLLGRAWYQRTPETVLIGIVVMAVYGGLIWGVLPLNHFVSWEGHLAGLIAGFAVAGWPAGRGKTGVK